MGRKRFRDTGDFITDAKNLFTKYKAFINDNATLPQMLRICLQNVRLLSMITLAT